LFSLPATFHKSEERMSRPESAQTTEQKAYESPYNDLCVNASKQETSIPCLAQPSHQYSGTVATSLQFFKVHKISILLQFCRKKSIMRRN
jgi:hypothetical protein